MLTIVLSIAAFIAAMFFNGQEIAVLAASVSSLVLALAWSSVRNRQAVADTFTVPAIVLIALTIWTGFSLVWSPAPFITAAKAWWFAALPLAFVLGSLPVGERWRAWQYRCFALVGCLSVGFQIVQWRAGQAPSGTLYYQHSLAALLNVLLFAGVAELVREPRLLTRRALPLLLAIGVFGFGIGLAAGRGAMLANLLGWLLIAVFLGGSARDRRLLVPFGLSLAGVALATVLDQGLLLERMATLSDPGEAGNSRFVIWQGAWELAKTQPWLGTGAGAFWLAYPAFRSAADTSAGFYVHNDYLQMLAELGVPGLVLMLTWLACMAAMCWRLARRAPSIERRAEVLGLSAAVLTVAAHSAIDFDFHILPILVAVGIFAGQLNRLGLRDGSVRSLVPADAAFLRRPATIVVVLLLAAIALVQLGAMGLAHVRYERSRVLAAEGRLLEADRLLAAAARLAPSQDAILLGRAELFIDLVSRQPPGSEEQTKLFGAAMTFVDKAQSLNEKRPNAHYLRARLLLAAGDGAGPERRRQIEAALSRALELDPWYHKARVLYAKVLLPRDPVAAARVLEAGADLRYRPEPELVEYLVMLRDLRTRSGDAAGALEVSEQLRTLLGNER